MKAGRELDALVAEKVMGWTRMRWCDYQQDARTTHTYSWHDHQGTMTELAEDDSDYDTPTAAWSPSTEIADAWLVVERMRERRRHMLLLVAHDSTRYHCNFFEGALDERNGIATADTVPLAICLAALRAVGVEVEE